MTSHLGPSAGTRMRAVVRTSPAITDVEFADVSVPGFAADELLVRVQAIGVGVHDPLFLPAEVQYPYTIGIEAAGTVVAVGEQVTGLGPGDRIAFVSAMQASGGTWAQYTAVRGDALIASVPDDVDAATAAALPVAGSTAVRSFLSLPDPLESGSVLFIAGGSGAIGTLAIQLARRAGWTVAASASPGNHEYMSSLGAEMTVDYRDPDWQRRILDWSPHGVQAALAIQPGTTAESLPVVTDAGTIVTVSGDPLATERDITVRGLDQTARVDAVLQTLLDGAADGSLQVEIERDYPFDAALEAIDKVRQRHARGKVVITIE
ncbi:NADP-dependent oxidoreductase [Brevibacterium aurantiacum]|uniref:NADP-dependent oxidoreductase n=1 Tax=Brevibacterium aurantiacum TaxID=273384 RepID=UPI003F90E7DF